MKQRRMFAVSLEGVGIIGGTLGYSRREAVNHFFGGGPAGNEWEEAKRAGHRTVEVCIEILNKGNHIRRKRRKH